MRRPGGDGRRRCGWPAPLALTVPPGRFKLRAMPVTALSLPPHSITSYCASQRVAAVYVAAAPTGRPPLHVGVAVDLRRALTSIERKGVLAEPIIVAAYWWDKETAKRLAAMVQRECGAGLSLPMVAASIVSAAQYHGVTLTPHARLLEKAGGAVGRLDASIETARRSGDLGFFNREFARRRAEASRAGKAFPPYRVALAKLRRVMAGAATAEASGGIASAHHGTLLRAVFGE
jgi:hypothetical protein